MKKTSLFLSVLLLMGGQVWASNVVATVNGQKIYKKEIQTKGIMKQLKIRYPEMTRKERKKQRFQLKVEALAERIRQIIGKEQQIRFGISATPAEGAAKWAELTRGVDFDETATETRKELEPLVKALKAVYEEKQSIEAVYLSHQLANSLSPEAWRLMVAAHTTPEKRKLLEQEMMKNSTEYKNPPQGFEYAVIQEKLNAAIDAEIGASDPDFAKYKQLIEQGAYNEAEAFKGPFYIETKRQEWWKDKYKKAKIEILDPKYKGALDLLYVS